MLLLMTLAIVVVAVNIHSLAVAAIGCCFCRCCLAAQKAGPALMTVRMMPFPESDADAPRPLAYILHSDPGRPQWDHIW